jgi:hypothetical protein
VPGAAAGLLLCLLAALLLRRDIRSLWRRLRWRSAPARVTYEPSVAGPAWRFDFTLPDGTPASAVTHSLRDVAWREGAGPVNILYDPRAPSRGIEVPGRAGFGTVIGLGLLAFGLAALLR